MTESLWMELLCDKRVCFCGFVSCVETIDYYTWLRETHLEWHMCMYICLTHTHIQIISHWITTSSHLQVSTHNLLMSNFTVIYWNTFVLDVASDRVHSYKKWTLKSNWIAIMGQVCFFGVFFFLKCFWHLIQNGWCNLHD